MGELTVVANLYKNDASTYELRVRWVLGENGSAGAASSAKLPLETDEFLTTFQRRDGAFLSENLTWEVVKEEKAHKFPVKPMLDVMLDPPREVQPVKGQDGRFYRRVATKPTSAGEGDSDLEWVKLTEEKHGEGGVKRQIKEGKGLTVRNLLLEVDEDKNLKDTKAITGSAIDAAEKSLRGLRGGGTLKFSRATRDDLLDGLTDMLVRSGARPQEFAQEIARVHKSLVMRARDVQSLSERADDFVKELTGDAPMLRRLELERAGSLAEVYSTVALMMTVWTDDAFLKSVERTGFDPEQVRRQLKLKALQGGSMIDFWSQEPGFDPTNNDGLRGELYPAFKMLGLGINIPDVPAATIAELTDAAANSFIQIKTRAASGAYGTATTLLLPNDIERANDTGMAFTPTAPRAAELNYDLVRSDPPSDTHPNGTPRTNGAQEPGFKTGNGAVEVHITPAYPRYLPRDEDGNVINNGAKVATETAFNLYAVWQGASGMDEYFLDTSQVPSLDKLRPYLVTRRYSYQRDLHGAFPDVGGNPHPALEKILNTPPWEAVLRRPEKVKDFNDYQVDTENSRSEETAPDVPDELYGGADGPTIFSFDLRLGLDAQVTAPAGLISAWDPRAETDYLWSPMKYRGQSDSMDQPQAYRLFVTSVDSFDVESEVVPVKAKDLDTGTAGDAYIFRPTYRTQLGAPDNLRLEFDPAAADKKLTLSWTMEEQPEAYGLRGTLEAFEADGHHLKATVRLFKRRIVGTGVEEDVIALREQETGGEIHWRGVTQDLLRRGWEAMPDKDTLVDVHAIGGTVSVDIDLDYIDLGYEYTAGVIIALPDKAVTFWSAPAENRRMFYVKRDDSSGGYEVKEAAIIDAPAASTVAVSDVITVPNADLPRSPEAGAPLDQMAFAKPVIPLPGIQRDPILARIATMPNSNDERELTQTRTDGRTTPARVKAPWLDTGFVLNEGQTASAEGALRRSLDSLRNILGNSTLEISDPVLREPRRLLARSFLRFAENAQTPGVDINLTPEVGLHPSIGFRGVLQLQWTYLPHIRSAPMEGEAEATAFDIFQAIIPNGEDEPRVQARSVLPLDMAPKGSANVTGNGYAISVSLLPSDESEQSPLLERLQSETQPICGLFKSSGNEEMLPFDVTKITLSGSTLNVSATPMKGSLGSGTGTVFLFFAVAVTQVATEGLDVSGSASEPVRHSVHLPVSGGESEYGFWYIVPRSAANRRGTRDRSLMVMRELADTIEPGAPKRVDLLPPQDRESVSLNPNNQVHKAFLPTAISTPEDARSNPRLVLTWAAAQDEDLLVVIYRQEERIDQEDESLRLRSKSDYLQYENIEAIRSLAEDGILDPALLVALSDPEEGWLSGFQVATAPNAKTPETPMIAAQAGLSAHDGLEIDIENGMAGFIDYRQTVANTLDAMDGNFRYRYQVQFARPLPQPAKAIALENAPRYLFSPVTAWTDWMVPEAPPIEASYALLNVEATPEAFNPEVEFQFEVGPSTALAQILRNREALEDKLDWEYRIVIRRRLSVLSPTEEGTEAVLEFKEVGAPLTINPKTPNEVFRVIDTRIERNFEEEELSLDYDIFIQQFALRQTPNGLVEQPVRSHEETPTVKIRHAPVRPPQGSAEVGMEIRRPIKVTIK